MAGPSYLSVGQVVDPYAGAQKALSQVGDIYNQFYDNTKKAEEANTLRLQREELQRARDNQLARKEHMQNFDPRLGIGGRGIDKDLYAQSQEERKKLEADNLAAFNAGNPAAKSPEEYAKLLDEADKSLITRKASEDVIREGLLRSGLYSPTEIDLLTPFYVRGVTDVSAKVAASQASADAEWERWLKTSGIPLEIQKAYLDDDKNKATIHRGELSWLNTQTRAGGSGSGSSGGSRNGRPSDLTMEEQTKFSEWGERRLGSKIWNRDGRNAEKLVFGSPIRINKALAEAGWPRETFVTTGETAQFAVNNVDSGLLDRSLRAEVDSPHGFEAEFSTWAGLPPRKSDGSFMTPQEYDAQGGDLRTIRSGSVYSGGGMSREGLPPPVLTGIRPELISAIQNIPEYRTKSKDDVHTEMINKVYKDLRLNVAGSKNADEEGELTKRAKEVANRLGNYNMSNVTTPIKNAMNETGIGNTADSGTSSGTSDRGVTPSSNIPAPEQPIPHDVLLPYGQPRTSVEADINDAVIRMAELQRGLANPSLSPAERRNLYQEAEVIRDSLRQLPDSDRIFENISGNARQIRMQSAQDQAQAREEQNRRELSTEQIQQLRELLAGSLSPTVRRINEDRLQQLLRAYPDLEEPTPVNPRSGLTRYEQLQQNYYERYPDRRR